MMQPLIWMFKVENFKKHFLSLFVVMLCLIALAVGFLFVSKNLSIANQFIFIVTAILCLFSVLLIFQGYFWELTSNIIERKTEVIASNVYDKRELKTIEKIELPEFNVFKFWWRGIASIVASTLLIYPLILLVFMSFKTSVDTFYMFNYTTANIITTYIGLYIFIGLFIPALLWNYASRNSIFAVWNLPKAIYVMGNYTIKYFKNVFLFLIFVAIQHYINVFIFNLLGFNQINWNLDFFVNSSFKVIMFFAITYSIYTYWMFVYAYLLGTIAPPDEK